MPPGAARGRMQDTLQERTAPAALLALYRTLDASRRRQLIAVLAAMLAGAAAELVTIGAVLPFLALLADPGRAAQLPGFGLFLEAVGGGSGQALVVKAALLLIAAAVAAALLRLLILRVSLRFVLRLARDIGAAVFARMLRQPYSLYLSRHSSRLLTTPERLQALVAGLLMPIVQGFVALVMALVIAAFLVWLDAATAAIGAGAIGLFYIAVTAAGRRRLAESSKQAAEAQVARMKAIQEGLDSIRDVLLDGSQAVFEESFRRHDAALRKAQATVMFHSAAPRYLIEAAGIALIGLLAVSMSAGPGGLPAALPLLGALALGAQRLMPLIQQVYASAAQFSGNIQVLRDLLGLLESPVAAGPSSDSPAAPLRREIAFDKVGFRFEGRDEWALADLDLVIPKGARIGFAGATGSGKSTFFDLVMGLLEPTSGTIRIDGEPLAAANRAGWQRGIAHVPQSICLIDSAIASNIAFGVRPEAIDMARVREAAVRAHVHDFIESLPAGFETPVGERGVKLSGGQRQRIALARALYKGASLLILDEATSALDDETEADVMEALAGLDPEMTILIAAHRASALVICDRIVRFDGGRIV